MTRRTDQRGCTDDAYTNANTVDVAAQVSGQVVSVHVRDQQAVKAGDPLFDIDPRNYEAAPAKAEAQLALARQSEHAPARPAAAKTGGCKGAAARWSDRSAATRTREFLRVAPPQM